MNNINPTQLIDEVELRAALQNMRPNRPSFDLCVRERIDKAEVCLRKVEGEANLGKSGWLQVAAAMIPLPLLGKSGGASLIQFNKLTLGLKIVGIAALPAIGLLLMVTATILATLKIRKVQLGQTVGEMDVQKLAEVVKCWWLQFGFWVSGISALSVLLMLHGYAIPVFIMFLISGIMMVSLVTKLGKEQLVDRSTIVAALLPGLMILVQMTNLSTMLSLGYPFLDQMLIPAVLTTGGLVMLLMFGSSKEPFNGVSGRVYRTSVAILLLMLAGWFSISLWNPVTTQDLKTHVESFDHARYSSASWGQWQVPAEWLQEKRTPMDLSKPHSLLLTELAHGKPNHAILCSAIETGLFQEQDLDQVPDLVESKNRMFREYERGRSFVSVDSRSCLMIRAWVMRGELSEGERDFLGERLRATMEGLRTKSYGNILAEQLAITQLAQLIDRPLDIEFYRDFVHKALVNHQQLGKQLGVRLGGFANSDKLNFSDLQATVDAIELMKIYGVPDGVRIDALRSYLRPAFSDHWGRLYNQACMRVTCLERLQSLPDVRPIRWLDYFRYEQSLMMTILFTLVCIFTAWGAPTLATSPKPK